MPDARLFGLVALGGALGALLRYTVGLGLARASFPAATLVVNIVGSFALAWVIFHDVTQGPDTPWRAFVGIGLLGAFTTMSAVSYETLHLATTTGAARGLVWGLVNLGLSVGAAVLGRAVALGVR